MSNTSLINSPSYCQSAFYAESPDRKRLLHCLAFDAAVYQLAVLAVSM